MLRTVLRKRVRVIAPIALLLVLSVFLTATTASAATKLIKADRGGLIWIAGGVRLRIERRALQEDTVISAYMMQEGGRVCFYFGPSGVTFVGGQRGRGRCKYAYLKVSWKVIEKMGLEDLTLYGEDGEAIEPQVKEKYVQWRIPHFSVYYHRRR